MLNLSKDTNNHIQVELPPDSPIWEPYLGSKVDLWTFIIASSTRGETVTILAEVRDGFGVWKMQFTKVDRQIHCGWVPYLFLSIYTSSSSVASFDSSSPFES